MNNVNYGALLMKFSELLNKNDRKRPILGWSHLYGEIQCRLTTLMCNLPDNKERVNILIEICSLIKNALQQLENLEQESSELNDTEEINEEHHIIFSLLTFLAQNIKTEANVMQKGKTRTVCEIDGVSMENLKELFKKYNIQ